MARKKNPHAVALGKLGGPKGGRARAKNLTPERLSEIARMGGLAGGPARAKALSAKQRSEISRKAAQTRWGPKPKRRPRKGKGGT